MDAEQIMNMRQHRQETKLWWDGHSGILAADCRADVHC